MMQPLIEVSNASILAPGGRPLFEGLNLRVSRGRVALIGRNGVGKSTLLEVLAGVAEVQSGKVSTSSEPHFVPQLLAPERSEAATERCAQSHGQRRKRALLAARASGAEILLLDEPTEDLDEAAVAWLRRWLRVWPGCVVVASHDRRLLADFTDFFLASELGCRHVHGTLVELERELERDLEQNQRRYLENLNRLGASQAHGEQVSRRRDRKKRSGRCRELDRATPRVRLNAKRSQAQVNHGRSARLRAERMASLKQWTLSTRRALPVKLSLSLPTPVLPALKAPLIVLSEVSAQAGERCLFESLSLQLDNQRLGVVGPNGAGKTTLLGILMGNREPSRGQVCREATKIAGIEQGGANWTLPDTLFSLLCAQSPGMAPEQAGDHVARLLVAHQFPLALSERALRSLSPGERTRAALIALFSRSPAPALLILDEPTFSLDLVGRSALTRALRAWPGGLVIASHDRRFLSEVGMTSLIELGA